MMTASLLLIALLAHPGASGCAALTKALVTAPDAASEERLAEQGSPVHGLTISLTSRTTGAAPAVWPKNAREMADYRITLACDGAPPVAWQPKSPETLTYLMRE